MGNFNDSFGGGMLQAAGNSVLGSLIGLATAGWQDRRQIEQQKKLQELQEAGNKRMADYQQKLAMEMWEKTNYPAQVEQLKLAGLNPGLLYGKGGGGGTTANASVGSVSGGSASSGQGEILQGIGLMQQQQQMRLQNAQIKVLESQANKNNVDAKKAEGVDTDLANKQIESLSQGIENAKAQKLLTEADVYLRNLQSSMESINIDFNKRTFDDRADEILWNAKRTFELMKQAENETYISNSTMKNKISIVNAEVIKSWLTNALVEADIKLRKAQTGNTLQSTEESKQRIEKIKSDIDVNKASIDKMAKDISQGQMKLDINEFDSEMRAKYPSLFNVIGESFNDMLQRLRGINGIPDPQVIYK